MATPAGPNGADKFTTVDDADRKAITYQNQNLWFPLSTVDESYNGTVTAGLTGARLEFAFNGTAIQVSGFQAQAAGNPPSINVNLDGARISQLTVPNSVPLRPFDFFVIASLPETTHVLEIEVANAGQSYPFLLDYITFVPFTPKDTETDAGHTGSSAPIGAIVGGVIGGVVVLVVAAIAIWYLFFRRKGGNKPYFYRTGTPDLAEAEQEAKPVLPASPSPPSQHSAAGGHFGPAVPQSPGFSQSAGQYLGSAPSAVSAYTLGAQQAHPGSDYGGSHRTSVHSGTTLTLASGSAFPRVTASPNQPNSKAAQAGLLSVPAPATYHADSGVRFDAHGQPVPMHAAASGSSNPAVDAQELTDVPPAYMER